MVQNSHCSHDRAFKKNLNNNNKKRPLGEQRIVCILQTHLQANVSVLARPLAYSGVLMQIEGD